jgi:hypothetical protein
MDDRDHSSAAAMATIGSGAGPAARDGVVPVEPGLFRSEILQPTLRSREAYLNGLLTRPAGIIAMDPTLDPNAPLRAETKRD